MSNIERKLNRLLSVLLVCLLLVVTPARAATSGALCITILDEADDPVPGVNVTLCQVVSITDGTAALTADFVDLPLSADQLMSDSGAGNAAAVYQYVHAKELTGTVKTTDADGVTDFFNLAQGVYLVFEEGGQSVSFQPYLVKLPTYIAGQPVYHIYSTPKTSQTDTSTFWVCKLWEDNMDRAGGRPKSVEVTLLRDGVPVRKVTLSAANDWMHQFYQLPADGTYTVQERAVFGYTAEYYEVIEGCIIVNKYTGGSEGPTPATGHVSVYKVWDDENDAAGQRPDRVSVHLICNGTVISTAALSAANNWSYTFTGLDKAKAYTVREAAVTGYNASYSGTAATGIIVTNSYSAQPEQPDPPTPVEPDPELIDIPLEVIWDDRDDEAGKRPGQVTVHLIANGSIISTLYPDPEGSWKGVFRDVPADLAYSVWELTVEEYSTTYSGSAARGFTVTNIYRQQTQPELPLPPQPPEPPPYEPSVPAGPSQPTIPQTGAQLWPVWLLLAAGGLLIVLGALELRRGRTKP